MGEHIPWIGGIMVAIVSGVITWFSTRGKIRAEAADLITQASSRLVEDISKDNAHLRETVYKLQTDVDLIRHQLTIAEEKSVIAEQRAAAELKNCNASLARLQEQIDALSKDLQVEKKKNARRNRQTGAVA